ncbi:MAG: fatty acid desaturase CarF family protein [Candidatus Binatia bacterium]
MSARPRLHVVFEAVAFAAFALLYLVLAARLARSLDDSFALAIALAALPLGLLAADFGSGFVHWACDTFFDEDTPVLGRTIIYGFREHHRDPLAMTRHGFLELNGASGYVLVPIVAGVLASGSLGPFGDAFVLVFAAGTALTNLFHRWAHSQSAPPLARFAQRHGWILSPQHHAVHHAPPHRRAYCVTTGWANCALDRVELWARAERWIRGSAVKPSS